MPVFTVIIPVYNAQTTLHRCLDSLQGQSFADFEALVIENGSTDTSAQICREYTEKDSRFILHSCRENCGPSGARNIGLEQAKGKYIAFVDSDDFVGPDYLQTLYNSFADADVVFMGYREVSLTGECIGEYIPPLAADSYCETLLQLHRVNGFGYTWIKAFRADIIGKHRFSEKLNLLEDELFACQVLEKPVRTAIAQKAIYNYVTCNSSSLTGRTHQDFCAKTDIAYCGWKKLLSDYENRDTALEQMANGFVNRSMYYLFEREVELKSYCRELKNTTFFADSSINSKFADYIIGEKYNRLLCMKKVYIIKNRLAPLVRRLKR